MSDVLPIHWRFVHQARHECAAARLCAVVRCRHRARGHFQFARRRLWGRSILPSCYFCGVCVCVCVFCVLMWLDFAFSMCLRVKGNSVFISVCVIVLALFFWHAWQATGVLYSIAEILKLGTRAALLPFVSILAELSSSSSFLFCFVLWWLRCLFSIMTKLPSLFFLIFALCFNFDSCFFHLTCCFFFFFCLWRLRSLFLIMTKLPSYFSSYVRSLMFRWWSGSSACRKRPLPLLPHNESSGLRYRRTTFIFIIRTYIINTRMLTQTQAHSHTLTHAHKNNATGLLS